MHSLSCTELHKEYGQLVDKVDQCNIYKINKEEYEMQLNMLEGFILSEVYWEEWNTGAYKLYIIYVFNNIERHTSPRVASPSNACMSVRGVTHKLIG